MLSSSAAPTLHFDPASNPLVALYPKLVHFYRFHKARKREVLPSDLCLNQLQIPLTLALKSGLTHPPSLGTQGIYTKIYTVDASGIQVSKQKNHIQINMENDQKIAHRVNCAMIKNDDRSDTICTVNQVTDFHRKRCSQHCKSQAISTVTTLVGRELKGQGVLAVRSPNMTGTKRVKTSRGRALVPISDTFVARGLQSMLIIPRS